MFALESGMMNWHKLGLDPIELPVTMLDVDPSNDQQWSSKSLKQCYARRTLRLVEGNCSRAQ